MPKEAMDQPVFRVNLLLVLFILSLNTSVKGSEPSGTTVMCTVTATQNNICPNTPVQLSHSGFGVGCTVTWYTGPNGTGSNLGTANPILLLPLATATYYAKPLGLCICGGEEQITIIVNKTFSTAGSAVSDTNFVCPDTPVNLIHSGFSLGSGAGGVSWFDGPNGTGTSFGTANPLTASPSSTTTYYAYSSGTCNDVQTAVTVTVDKIFSQVGRLIADTTELCPGDSAALFQSGFVQGSGAGMPGWYTGPWGTGVSLGILDSLEVSPGMTTTYYVFLEGICNQVQDSLVLTVWPGVIADAGPDQTICEGESTPLGGQSAASGGTGPFLYTWTPGSGLSTVNTPNPIAVPPASTLYTLSIEDSKGCQDISTARVTVKDLPVFQFVGQKDPSGCDLKDGELSIDATAMGGSLWYRLITLDEPDTLNWQNSMVFEELGRESYRVEMEYSQAPGCGVIHPDTFLLVEPEAPVAEVLVSPGFLCPFEIGSFLATEDTGQVSYLWLFGAGASLDSAQGAGLQEVFFNEEGIVPVRLITERNNCLAEATTPVTILPIPEILIGGGSSFSEVVIPVASGATFSTNLSVSPVSGLFWTAETVVGEVTNLTATGEGNRIQAIFTLPEGQDSAVIQYTISTATGECEDTAMLKVRVLRPLFIPNLVSPNGDGWNDTWDIQVNRVEGYRPEDFSVSVFNRSGGRVYQAPVTESWTGEGSPDGTYWYQLFNKATDETITGFITLIRN
ncbi:gliding motility-associated C-terminal domain-containing protein [bacterium]|nr:gliding motility-associated C-terminal domain-containing protein [bacterium]